MSNELERYKRALYQANGRLIQLGLQPVKLDYTNLGPADRPLLIAGDDKTEARPVASTARVYERDSKPGRCCNCGLKWAAHIHTDEGSFCPSENGNG